MEVKEHSLDDLRRVLARIAGEAAGFVRDKFGLGEWLSVEAVRERDESLRIDLVSEEYIFELLRAEGLRCTVLTEERGLVKLGNDPYIIVLDPLDGSKNFASLVPWAAISMALAPLKNDEPPTLLDIHAGAVAPLFHWPVISFAKGRGVFEGASRPVKLPAKKLVLYYAESEHQLKPVHRLLQSIRASGLKASARSLGSAALEISWTALGRAYAFLDLRGKLRTVDVAAAIHAALEAGAVVIVEKWSARIDGVNEVGSVVVAPEDTWPMVSDALESTGFESLIRNALRRG